MPTSTITERTLEAQPILFIRREVAKDEIAAAIGSSLGAVVPHCLERGLTFAGPPFTRYTGFGPDGFTIEVGVPLAAPADGAGEIEAGLLPAGAPFSPYAKGTTRSLSTRTRRWSSGLSRTAGSSVVRAGSPM